MIATEMALNNPLIDEYSLQGAKGLLINITGSKDLTLFEVDQATNKIRAEVDPDAELIFGAIKDENMVGKIRVSIVATALDGHKQETKTVLNMVSRIQNRNTGYSDSLFSHNTRVENNPINSIDGATALKLDESYELNTKEQNDIISNFETSIDNQPIENSLPEVEATSNIPSGVSIESASYIENNTSVEDASGDIFSTHEDITEEYAPKLFSEEESYEENNGVKESSEDNNAQLFDQDTNEDEDFEIPAFLRKQKF